MAMLPKSKVQRERKHQQKHQFAFTGMIRCGECGLSVTASNIKNRFGSRYTYYHCTRRRLDYRCRQPYVPLESVEHQVLAFLESITISEPIHQWLLERLERMADQDRNVQNAQKDSLEKARSAVERQLDNLTKLRLRDLVNDEEYTRQRQELERERIGLAQKLENAGSAESWFEPARLFVSFSSQAVSCFTTGDMQTKRLILEITGLNPTLRDEKLNIEAKKPFRYRAGPDDFSKLWKGRDLNPRGSCEPAAFRKR